MILLQLIGAFMTERVGISEEFENGFKQDVKVNKLMRVDVYMPLSKLEGIDGLESIKDAYIRKSDGDIDADSVDPQFIMTVFNNQGALMAMPEMMMDIIIKLKLEGTKLQYLNAFLFSPEKIYIDSIGIPVPLFVIPKEEYLKYESQVQ